MPITIQTSSIKYKNGQGTYQSADVFKGDKGDKGDAYVLTAADKQDIAASVDSGAYVVYVEGTDPEIDGQPNMQYICDTVNTITINAPVEGTIIVQFTSGDSPAVLTMDGVIMPEWWGGVEAGYVYELCIENMLGSAIWWPRGSVIQK